MRQFFTLLALIAFNLQIQGQTDKISAPELDSLYFKTVQSQYFYIINGTIYVEINQFTDRLKSIKALDYLRFMTPEELIKESLRTRKNLDVIRVAHRIISADTIDINIGYLDVKAKRALNFNKGLSFTKADFSLSCGGTEGYMPTCRFIYDSKQNKWIKLESIK